MSVDKSLIVVALMLYFTVLMIFAGAVAIRQADTKKECYKAAQVNVNIKCGSMVDNER